MLLQLISAHGCLNNFATRFYIAISSLFFCSATKVLSLHRARFFLINKKKMPPHM
jgi:hypothetical protein